MKQSHMISALTEAFDFVVIPDEGERSRSMWVLAFESIHSLSQSLDDPDGEDEASEKLRAIIQACRSLEGGREAQAVAGALAASLGLALYRQAA